jgi:hypothetical protein
VVALGKVVVEMAAGKAVAMVAAATEVVARVEVMEGAEMVGVARVEVLVVAKVVAKVAAATAAEGTAEGVEGQVPHCFQTN